MPSKIHTEMQRELEAGLRGLEAQGQKRTLAELSGVNLCSNDYLGLAEHPALKETLLEAVRSATRLGGTGSRLLSGHAKAWDEVEEEFAEFAGTDAALYFGSGYAANLGLLASLVSKDDVVFSDALNHASLIDGIRLSGARKEIYGHCDLGALEDGLRRYENHRCRKLIVTESVFSMDGDVAPIAEMCELAERYGAGLIVDEAHATAVHGPSGRGIAAHEAEIKNIVAVVHTCGKALASAGAFVCGSGVLKEHLINHARTFIFSTAMPAYMATQIQTALRLSMRMEQQREGLKSRATQLTGALHARDWNTSGSATQIVPVVIGGNDEALSAANFLQQEGFAVRAIRPPTVPQGSSRLRLSLTTTILPEQLTRLANALENWRAGSAHAHEVARHA